MAKVSAYQVAVIGGGVIGTACARAAALRQLHTVILEPGPDPAAASPASAGMLAAQIEPSDDLMLGLCVRGRDVYEHLAATLKDTTGIDIAFWRGGIAAAAFDEPQADGLREAAALQRQAGLRCDWLSGDEVRERWPGAAPDATGALLASEDGAVDPQALTRALLADARRLGASLLPRQADRIIITGDRVTGIVVGGETVAVEQVVLAAGAWSPLLEGLPRPLAVTPVRGQMAATPWPGETPPAILYYDHGYVLTRGAEAVLGSTMEHAGFDCRVTNEGLAQIFRCAVRLLPAVARLPVLRTWAGLRPVTPDGRPIVGPDPDVRGLFYATGHGRNGVLLAALTGDTIGDLLSKGSTDLDLTPFRPNR
ncbi:MAG: glycine oxidase ThiO [Gemmatimonadetes bacterium 13_1_40CM_4_69_8]|nr:MAG: glycine oxidase ThiO [Gemmatimonadetes bacterium 13_1_40CM_70_15]OLC76173.1 MAG: glycine oxidase ThiO [Gemmatimonadetes bacterium 13_1_40CM_4_69_8]PYP74739.1 MAG: glycine oxidase ThiO [Gemmatimonadota bacterium]